MSSTSPSGVGIAHLPNQKHKIISKKGAHYTLMVCGESGLGKTTFINTLFATTIKDSRLPEKRFAKQLDKTVEIEVTKAELEEKLFKIKLSIIDTPGFGDYVNNRDSWIPIVDFIDDQHENYMRQEQQPTRHGKIDMRVHACLYFIRPTGHRYKPTAYLKPLDIEVMKRLGSRVNLIPVIAKADTLTPKDLAKFKQNASKFFIVYACAVDSDDEDTTARNQNIVDASPYAVIGSTEIINIDGKQVRGREYSWGVAEVENDDHCDFKKLRNLLIRTHMLDLISSTEEMHYEHYRQQQMANRKFGEPKIKKAENPKLREKEEELRKSFTEKVRDEESRFRQWEQQLIQERNRLNKDLESQHAHIKHLESELDNLYQHGRSGSMRR
ncbi:hypothetical protein INT47_004153 [Mucor saturninus]|uniref:Septin-type G domain-containing protein n=1 Tax=Mucor saturninus TaxID=64648 RepID=A0A8H7QLL9_9FUNG|nr:hypothetical protein INT47_004153 [Mucor saturninus]